MSGGGAASIEVRDTSGDDDDHGRERLNIRSSVSPDGRRIGFDMDRGKQHSSMPMSFAEASLAYHELRVGLGIAKGRQLMTHDLAREAVADLIQTALRPKAICFQIDSVTGDTFVVYLFDEHAPFAVRLSPAQIQVAQGELASLRQRKSN